jgi:hypothetical protein
MGRFAPIPPIGAQAARPVDQGISIYDRWSSEWTTQNSWNKYYWLEVIVLPWQQIRLIWGGAEAGRILLSWQQKGLVQCIDLNLSYRHRCAATAGQVPIIE